MYRVTWKNVVHQLAFCFATGTLLVACGGDQNSSTSTPQLLAASTGCQVLWDKDTTYQKGAAVSYRDINYTAAMTTSGDRPSSNSNSGPAGSGKPWITGASCSGTGSTSTSTTAGSTSSTSGNTSSTTGSSTTTTLPASGSWRGNFDGFNSAAWLSAWGVIANDSFGFGMKDMVAVTDSTSPDGHQVLKVSYTKGSSAPSCNNCPSGPNGGQFYQDLSKAGRSDLTLATTVHMRYYIKLGDANNSWDFGGSDGKASHKAGKLPGMWGGTEGSESGGASNSGDSFSTRYMWREGKAEVYSYEPSASGGYGGDHNFSGATWQADAKWHYVEQAVNRMTGKVDVWYDGKQVMSGQGIGDFKNVKGVKGIFFSTFYGGHDTEWGPSKNTTSYFAKFEVSTSYIGP